MKKIVKLLEELDKLTPNSEGHIILFFEECWQVKIREALDLVKIYKVLLSELQEGVDPDFYVELKKQLGLE